MLTDSDLRKFNVPLLMLEGGSGNEMSWLFMPRCTDSGVVMHVELNGEY